MWTKHPATERSVMTIKPNKVSFQVWGKYALFSDPITRVGGEKSSYPIPTYQAMIGILESCYWKPTILWHVDRMRVVNPIKTQTRGARPLRYQEGGNDLAIYTYLTDVHYQVEAHFEWNERHPELAADRNENKHHCIARRMIERGGRRDVFLGTRECQAYVTPCEFGSGTGAYDSTPELDFGVMVHGLNYPDSTGSEQLEVRLWRPAMKNGIVEFCRPEECSMVRPLTDYGFKPFALGRNCASCDELYREIEGRP